MALATLVPVVATFEPGAQAAAPVGQGFELNASDLRFILQQIQIAEHHVANTTAQTGVCGALIGDGPDQIPPGGVGVTLPWGLRTVSGVCNNLVPNQQNFGTGDQPFPRLAPAEFRPNYPLGQTVGDLTPRQISNLIVDQSVNNPAAVDAAGGTVDADEEGNLFIPNVAPDTGLSAPYNSWFTLFGQFFDHGLDLVNKGGSGTVVMPLMTDDPLWNKGPNVMFLTRASVGSGTETHNQTSSWVDQSQTYASHPAHQVFLREYEFVAGKPVATGRLLIGPGDGMADWAAVKRQARTILGIELLDTDVFNVPMVLTDLYGNFVPGVNGLPQLVNPDQSLTEGALPVDLFSPAQSAAGAMRTGHAFLDDIAHHATPGVGLTPDADTLADPGPDGNPYEDDGLDTTYDDEMLDAHFIAGDGRANENIGLTAVHHVFHSEHNRLAEEIDAMITGVDSELTAAERAEWLALNEASGFDYHERVFQAARFVTEMQYQHLAFEEFARKVQPMVNLFGEGGTGYHTDIDPRITAEFAHAVYRFGHSMLNETVDRTTADGTQDNMLLLDAFLNPPSFFDNATNAKEAAGNIVRGMTRQVANELDEFVTEALRNDLVGLPLDLAALNIARGRDTGIPTLNSFRRTIFARTGDTQLQPYTSWIDFGLGLRNESSLTNFIAAYGTHPTITAQATVAGRRAAAQALVQLATGDPLAPGFQDAVDFLDSTPGSTWESNGLGVTKTGVDRIDLWMGGLAEKQMVFGGLLGSTFNYVFEYQMESLQDGDRFYYLSRTAGLNLLTQLEGNSFAELIQRNTDVQGLPGEVFSRPTYTFDLNKQNLSGPILDDPVTDWHEPSLLIREPSGTIRYAGPEHVTFNGSPGNDKVRSSEGDDTFRGNLGDDRYEGGDGNDQIIGGDGDDILTDLMGDEMIKGGPGNDTISSGRGFGGDLAFGGDGNDFIIGGNDMTESFGGAGNDFIFAGDAEDTVFGDEGDDWIEGGRGPFALLQGDSGAPFQDDPNQPGHDVIYGWGGEQDYDAEGGDDIMFAGPGIQRAEGMQGFDWVTHRGDPVPGNSDMSFSALLPPAVDVNRDRFDLVEALSGWKFDDVLRGDDGDAGTMTGHELTAAGIARILGLDALIGPDGFTGGNIILGGAGSDLIEGRGGDDRIDGDLWLDAQLRVPDLVNGGTKLVDNLPALRADVMAGRINPGDIVIERRIKDANDNGIDTAIYAGPMDEYFVDGDITTGVITVEHVGGLANEGRDTLSNIERIVFADGEILSGVLLNQPATGTVTIVGDAVEDQTLSVTSVLDDPEGVDPATIKVSWQIDVSPNPLAFEDWVTVSINPTLLLDDALVGEEIRAVVTFKDLIGVNEQVIGNTVGPVVNIDDPTLGVPVLSTLAPEATVPTSVDTTGITDADGLTGGFTYQWFADGNPIPGATTAGYTPTLADAGTGLIVEVSWVDDHGTAGSTTAGPTGPVTVPPLPDLTVDRTTVSFGTRASGSTPLALAVTVGNDGTAPLVMDGATITGPDSASFALVDGCTAPLLNGETCTVGVTLLTDGPTGGRTATLTIPSNDLGGEVLVPLSGTIVTNVAPTGAPTVNDATPIEGQVLSAGIATVADGDGLTGTPFLFRWQQSGLGGGGNFIDIPGAVAPTFTVTQDQVNRRLRVVTTFTDDHGTVETLTSAATAVTGDVFIGTIADETWTGTEAGDNANGMGGNDTLNGRGDVDTLAGGAGNDTVNGEGGNDVILVGPGHGFDAVSGGNGTDTIRATANSTVIGLRSLAGIEVITANGFSGVIIAGTTGVENLNFGAVTLVGIVRIEGGGGNDTITGSAAADDIRGGTGNDTLGGGGGNDTIQGGGGTDVITPGAGNDVVVSVVGDGTNTVNGFDSNPNGGQDRLDVRQLGVTAGNFAATVSRVQVGGTTRVTIGSVVILLPNVNVGTITIADFIV